MVFTCNTQRFHAIPRNSEYLRSFSTKTPPQCFRCRPKHHLRTQQENLGIRNKKTDMNWGQCYYENTLLNPNEYQFCVENTCEVLAREISGGFASFNLQVLKSCSNGHSTFSPNKKPKDWHLYCVYTNINITLYMQFLHMIFSGGKPDCKSDKQL